MAKNETKKEIARAQICSECTNATWQWKHEHIDLKGKPICLTCPHQEWWIIRGTEEKDCPYYNYGSPQEGNKPKWLTTKVSR